MLITSSLILSPRLPHSPLSENRFRSSSKSFSGFPSLKIANLSTTPSKYSPPSLNTSSISSIQIIT
eukprot:UN10849